MTDTSTPSDDVVAPASAEPTTDVEAATEEALEVADPRSVPHDDQADAPADSSDVEQPDEVSQDEIAEQEVDDTTYYGRL